MKDSIVTPTGTAVATGKRKNRIISEPSLCRTISLDVAVDHAEFDPAALAKLIPNPGTEWDLEAHSLTGPLRLGGRGNDAYRLTGSTAVHGTGSGKHYHIRVTGSLEPKPFRAASRLPTVAEFFTAVMKGVRSKGAASVSVMGQHFYPREWWTGDALPVPLPSRGHDYGAQLTGLEVTYAAESEPERVILSAVDDSFVVLTLFEFDSVASDAFNDSLRRSAEIGARLFVDPSTERA